HGVEWWRAAPVLVVELLAGGTLADRLRQGPMAEAEVVVMARQVLAGLSHLHGVGMLHRDIKPSNIGFTADGAIKVLDFGLSRVVGVDGGEPTVKTAVLSGDSGISRPWDEASMGRAETHLIVPEPLDTARVAGVETERGSVLGTPDFMSPEQARGEAVGPASDIYSFGLLLQVLFTGRPPYEAGLSVADQIRRARAGDTVPLAGLDPDLTVLVNRMKSLAAGARPSAAEVAERLLWIRAKPRRRLRRLAAVAAIAVLTVFAAVMAFQAVRIGQEARRANLEAERARQEAAAARAVSDFLVGLFEVSDPGEARGNTVTAREILDEGARGLDRKLLGQPLTRARLMEAIGAVYMNLGLYDQALALLQQALALRKSAGASDVERASSLHNLATLHHHKEAYALAEPLYREALGIRERALGPMHPDVATTLNQLAALRRAQGDFDEAVPLYRRALAISEKALGPDHPDVGAILNNLAVLYRLKGDFARAEPLFRRDLEISEKALGANHPDLATSLNNLAVLYHETGDDDRAAPLFERSLAMCEKAMGPDHAEVAITLANLGKVHYTRGDYDRAEPLLRRACDIFARALGKDSRLLVRARTELARLRIAQGQLADAARLLDLSLEACDRLLGRDPDNPPMRSAKAVILVERGRVRARKAEIRRAASDWEEALALTEALLAKDPETALVQGTRAKALLLLGRDDEARPLLGRLLAKRWNDPDLLALCREHGLGCRPGG
ncbi:MAG TPA: serine/threonine-protein kinase, partial [Vicinamibacteria bacterium]